MGKIEKEEKWVPHEFTEENKVCQYDIALSLVSFGLNRKNFAEKKLKTFYYY